MTRQMKDSGVEWIGEIPEKWNAKKFKYIFSIIGGNGFPENLQGNCNGDYPFFKCSDINGTEREVLLAKNFVNSNIVDKYKFNIIPSDSILMAKIGEALKKNHRKINKKPCIVDNNMQALVFKSYECLMYYHYLSTILDMMWFDNGGTIPSVNNVKLKNFLLPNPPLSEQKAIADYLDAKCAKIDAFIAKQKTVIEKLKEYKQSVITEAVTKGLNPAVPMKSSGVEWIGDIPEKWNVFRIKNVAFLKGRIGWQGLKSDEYQEDGPFLVTGKDFKNGKIDWMSCVHITEERFDEAPEIHIRENDLLITKDGTVGKVAIAKNCPLKVSLNSGVLLIRSKNNSFFDQKFLYYVLCSNIFWMWFLSTLNGNSTIIHLYQEDFSNFRFSLPPLSDQKEIADYLDKKCAEIDAFIAKKQVVIEKLTEYKKIADL